MIEGYKTKISGKIVELKKKQKEFQSLANDISEISGQIKLLNQLIEEEKAKNGKFNNHPEISKK